VSTLCVALAAAQLDRGRNMLTEGRPQLPCLARASQLGLWVSVTATSCCMGLYNAVTGVG